ncbi:MAG: hypothetical protein IKI97_04375 [Clostridia bacterium]|nr:hypothetical protein [Clostridia bacterium]
MLKAFSNGNKSFSKDANSTAPSTFCAHNSANFVNNAVITGIAAAVSVFLLFALIGIIFYGIIIHSIIMIAMPIIIISAIIIMRKPKKLNIAKLCVTRT